MQLYYKMISVQNRTYVYSIYEQLLDAKLPTGNVQDYFFLG